MPFWDPLRLREFDREPFDSELMAHPYYIERHRRVHRTAIRLGDLLAVAVFVLFLVATVLFAIYVLSRPNGFMKPKTPGFALGGTEFDTTALGAFVLWLVLIPSCGVGAAILSFGVGILSRLLFASATFFQGPIGRRWMKLAGTGNVWVARVLSVMVLSLVAAAVYVIQLYFGNWL